MVHVCGTINEKQVEEVIMIFGYARVITKKQNLELQMDELNRYGCDEIINDNISGTKVDRERINSLL